MAKKSAILEHNHSYSFNKTRTPLPELNSNKARPPMDREIDSINKIDTTEMFKPKPELSLDEQAQEYMDAYRKAERIIIINFYTGGGAYKKGILDAIYRGYNPLNP